MAKANEPKSGDRLAGFSAETELERMAAKTLLAETPLSELYENPAVPYERDEVSRVVYDSLDLDQYRTMQNWTVAELRGYLLSEPNDDGEIQRRALGLTPEMAAAAAKIMSNMDLLCAAKKIRIVSTCRTTLGRPGVLACRLQPNHPADRVEGIRASILEGLSYGAGDALIGVNPVDDRPASVARVMDAIYETAHETLNVPTQTCVLAHIATQMECMRGGAKADVLFQSIAGTQKGNESFGVDVAVLREGFEFMRDYEYSAGPNRMYFETGQGSELSAGAHEGIDQVTLEARCYGLARCFKPFMVNSVVGFIGPEYLYDAKQITRAGLEDHFMGKLMGLPMGLDVCYTNHSQSDQNDLENLAALLTAAGVNFFMGVPLGDDVMLNYQTTSYHDIASLRELFDLSATPEFTQWMQSQGLLDGNRLTRKAGDATCLLK
ncbi:MAG: ethanolamine ammonia-lyase subunit EutB [bacterium]|nr:ethanolamine ammonia-lyase subunit EutB [bacterium]